MCMRYQDAIFEISFEISIFNSFLLDDCKPRTIGLFPAISIATIVALIEHTLHSLIKV